MREFGPPINIGPTKILKMIKLFLKVWIQKKNGIASIENHDKSNICLYSFSEPLIIKIKKNTNFTNFKTCIAGGNLICKVTVKNREDGSKRMKFHREQIINRK
jgi:hypothetical protein